MREQLRSVRPLDELAVLGLGETGGDEVAHRARLVDGGDDAVARGGQGPGGVDGLLQHGGEVEARAGAQDGRVQRGDALAGRVELSAQVVEAVHRSSSPCQTGPRPARVRAVWVRAR